MIKGITQSGKYVTVSGGMPSNPYISPGSAGVGMVRYNPNMNVMEVNDGVSWKEIGNSFASVGLTSEAESLLDWARDQRNKQWEYESMAKDHPAVQNALASLERAKEQLDLVYKLSKDYENEGVATSP